MSKVRFIIGGGASKGAVFLGFLDHLLSTIKIKVDHCYGTSIGAMITPYVVSNKVGEFCDVLWDTEDIMEEMFVSGTYKNPFLNLLFNLGFYKSANMTLGDIIPPDVDYSRCTAVCTALPSLEDIWFTGDDFPEGAIASLSIPILFEPYIIKRAPKCMGRKNLHKMSWYVDGATTEMVPISTLWNERTKKLTDNDFDGVYVVLCGDLEARNFLPGNKSDFKNFVAAIEPNNILVVDINQYLPDHTIVDNFSPDRQLIRDYITLGRRIAAELIRTRGKELGFKKKNQCRE